MPNNNDDNTDDFYSPRPRDFVPGAPEEGGLAGSATGSVPSAFGNPQVTGGNDPSSMIPDGGPIGSAESGFGASSGYSNPPEIPDALLEPHFLLRITPGEARISPGDSLDFTVHVRGKVGMITNDLSLRFVDIPQRPGMMATLSANTMPVFPNQTSRVTVHVDTNAGTPLGTTTISIQVVESAGVRYLTLQASAQLVVAQRMIQFHGVPHEPANPQAL